MPTEREWAEIKRQEASRLRLCNRFEALVKTAVEKGAAVSGEPGLAPGRWWLSVRHYGSYLSIDLQLLQEGASLLPLNGRIPLVNALLKLVDTDVRAEASRSRLTVEEGPGSTAPIVAGEHQYPIGRLWKLTVPNPR